MREEGYELCFNPQIIGDADPTLPRYGTDLISSDDAWLGSVP